MPSPPPISLRAITEQDLPTLFLHQSDPESNQLAAVFPRAEQDFMRIFKDIINDPTITARAITENNQTVGQISIFTLDAKHYIGYWIAREHWGRRIATRAIAHILEEVTHRPIFARVASHNPASIRALQSNAFQITGTETTTATDRFQACEETLLTLA